MLTASTLTLGLTPAATRHLSITGGNQFRVTLPQNQFSNFNGVCVCVCCVCVLCVYVCV